MSGKPASAHDTFHPIPTRNRSGIQTFARSPSNKDVTSDSLRNDSPHEKTFHGVALQGFADPCRSSVPRALPSLFPISQPVLIFASGPKVSQAQARSYIR